jgi:hypothetical protein
MPILGAQSAGTKGSPTAPTIGTVTLSGTAASVPFTAPSFSKLPITGYTVTSSIGSLTNTGASSPITISGLSPGTTYTFTVTATNANGTSTASAASNSVTPTYAVGGVGQGGGKIFYDAGSTLSWGRYLEVATSSSSPSWTDSTQAFSGNTSSLIGTDTAIGTGRANTQAGYAQNSTGGRAISTTWTYTGGGFNSTVNSNTGWFLPSKDELNILYGQKTTIGGFSASYFWSSSEFNGSNAYAQDFGGGTSIYDSKSFDNSIYVRPIRAF